MAKADEIFVHEREPNPEWQADLDRIAPTGGRANWLKIVWYPGEPYEPIGRWVIYEMIVDLSTVPSDFLIDINGPDPKTVGYWQRDGMLRTGTKRWHSDSLVSHIQWKLFKETHCYPNLTWIIQGDKGGHLYKFGPTEIECLKKMGGDEHSDTPLPGDLPYADYDRRVSSKLAERDKLRKWRRGMGFDERGMTKTAAGLHVYGERNDMEQEYNMRLLKWIEDQMEEAISDIPRSLLPSASDFPDPVGPVVDEDELDRKFVEETSTRTQGD
ncbi:MAG: hypothetical protein ACYTBZ_27795 [Planctomycetota bacterium]